MANNLFSAIEMGKNSIMAQQSVFSVIGHNIANVNTPGYSRQVVDLENVRPSVIGLKDGGRGVEIMGIRSIRDQFIDNQITDRKQYDGKWDTLGTIMASVEALFDESTGMGISDGLSNFFNAWNDVANHPTDIPTRNSLISKANSYSLAMSNTVQRLTDQQEVYDGNVGVLVDEINEITNEIAQLNEEIAYATGRGNPANDLLDTRERRIRELSEKIGINHYYDKSNNSVTIEVAGRPLVAFTSVNELSAIRNPYNHNYFDVYVDQYGVPAYNITNDLNTGQMGAFLLGRDGETVQGPGTVTLIDPDTPSGGQSTVQFSGDHGLSVGDLLTVDGETRSVLSITSSNTVIVANFTQNQAGNEPFSWETKRGYIPEYKNQLNNLAAGLIAQVNNLHQSGYALDTTTTDQDFFLMNTAPAGVTASITNGSNTITFNTNVSNLITTLSVGDVITVGGETKTVTSMNAGGFTITVDSDFNSTSAGAAWGYANRQAAAASLEVDPPLVADPSLIAASSNGAVGNNEIALQLAQLMDANNVVDSDSDGTGDYGTFHEYLHSMMSDVGNAGNTANYEYDANSSMLKFLENKRDSISAVSLDEEAANLMQFEKSYQALAQFMGTVSELTDVLIQIV